MFLSRDAHASYLSTGGGAESLTGRNVTRPHCCSGSAPDRLTIRRAQPPRGPDPREKQGDLRQAGLQNFERERILMSSYEARRAKGELGVPSLIRLLRHWLRLLSPPSAILSTQYLWGIDIRVDNDHI
jgi:hypothetical protein